MKYQSFVCYRLNPNEQELNGEVSLNRNIDGRIFSDCILEVKNNTAILINSDDFVEAVVSLEHFYLIKLKV